jgi:hypothetical protein
MTMDIVANMRVLLVTGMVAMAAVACRQRDAAATQPAVKPPPSETTAEATATTEGKSQFDEAAFSLSIAPRAKVVRGQSGEVVISLSAKAPYHVNQEYPHRFKVTAVHGLATPSSSIMRDPAKVTPARLELVVPVTLDPSGPHKLDGELAFSLCTDERCLMENRSLSALLDAQ